MSRTWDADAYQKAEERLCECGAAGSGEGHVDWCPWLGSKWHQRALARASEGPADTGEQARSVIAKPHKESK